MRVVMTHLRVGRHGSGHGRRTRSARERPPGDGALRGQPSLTAALSTSRNVGIPTDLVNDYGIVSRVDQEAGATVRCMRQDRIRR